MFMKLSLLLHVSAFNIKEIITAVDLVDTTVLKKLVSGFTKIPNSFLARKRRKGLQEKFPS